jgi:hypothetical protein
MTTGGWIFMLSSWVIIIGVSVFCYIRTFSDKPPSADEKTDSKAS